MTMIFRSSIIIRYDSYLTATNLHGKFKTGPKDHDINMTKEYIHESLKLVDENLTLSKQTRKDDYYSRIPQIVRFFVGLFLAKRTICGRCGRKNGQSVEDFSNFVT